MNRFTPLRILSRVPLPLLYRVSDVLAPVCYHVVRYRRRVVRENLQKSFPSAGKWELKRIERKFYRWFCDYIVETLKMLSFSPSEMRRRMTFSGVEEIHEALQEKSFVIVYLGHYGNWEWISSLPLWNADKDVHLGQIYRPLKNKGIDDLFGEMRTRFGAENIAKHEVVRRMITIRREEKKYVIGFISDQSPSGGSQHAFTTFLHQDTAMLTGPETLAKRFDAAVYFGYVTRPCRGRYHCAFKPLVPAGGGEISTIPDYQLTELFLQQLEEMITSAPHLWLWTHRRWKHQRP